MRVPALRSARTCSRALAEPTCTKYSVHPCSLASADTSDMALASYSGERLSDQAPSPSRRPSRASRMPHEHDS